MTFESECIVDANEYHKQLREADAVVRAVMEYQESGSHETLDRLMAKQNSELTYEIDPEYQ
jgi:hypothetical protein